jgi:hypothetical protein
MSLPSNFLGDRADFRGVVLRPDIDARAIGEDDVAGAHLDPADSIGHATRGEPVCLRTP